ncbi:arsenate reductase (glutaredoxin) [Craterilacuibacter sp.]|uniref:arsenate reductase (glutaredoxin) n=1 Tax=Craterilacuibacter sp. TaxID=2870909 RepID=UPI003F366DA2
MIRLYHNPRCSKSREALQLLQDAGAEVEVIEYLKQVPSIEELEQLLSLLGMVPRELMRQREEEYEALYLDDIALEHAQLLAALHNNPCLIERPIAIKGERAVIGRPPEKVLTLL